MTCSNCGADVASGGRFCRVCGTPIGARGKHVVGRNCPYCHFLLQDGAAVMECDSCHALHHEECWSENGGCAVASCERGPDGSAPSTLPTSDMPAAARPASKLQVDLGSAAAGSAPEPPVGSAGGPGRRGRGLWIAVVVSVVVAILAGGATAAVLIVIKKDDGDSQAQDAGTGGGTGTTSTSGGSPEPDPNVEDSPTAFTPASTDQFSVEVPADWRLKADAEKQTNGDDVLYHSEWSARDGSAVVIDMVPDDVNGPAVNARIVPKGRKARAVREGEQYRLISREPVALDEQRVWEWVYEIDGRPVVDYFLSMGANSYAVQTTGTTLADERRIGRRAVTTLNPS